MGGLSTVYLATDEDVRKELERRIGGEPDGACWDDLVEQNFVSTVIEQGVSGDDELAEAEMASLVLRYRELFRRFGRNAQRRSAPRTRRELPPGVLEAALAEIVEVEAERRVPMLANFRRLREGVLPLAPEEVASWVESRVAATFAVAGTFLWVEVPEEVPEGGLPRADARLDHLKDELDRMKQASEWRLGRQRVETISFPRPDGAIDRLPIPRVVPERNLPPSAAVLAWQELTALKELAGLLVREYPLWVEAEAVAFVFTGRPPIPVRGRASLRASRVRALGTVVLELSPHLEPGEVLSLYRAARGDLLGADERVRRPSEQRIKLARFVARANTGRSWRDAMDAWNAVVDDSEAGDDRRRYQDYRSFRRDAREAYRQVTGDELDWIVPTKEEKEG